MSEHNQAYKIQSHVYMWPIDEDLNNPELNSSFQQKFHFKSQELVQPFTR